MPKPEYTNYLLRLPIDLKKAIEALAKKDKRSFNSFINLLLEKAAKENKEEGKC